VKRRLKSTRHYLKETVKEVYILLHALGVRIHTDKISIKYGAENHMCTPMGIYGRVEKCCDLPGIYWRSTGMAVSEATLSHRGHKVTRLYEEGASKECVWAYLRRWPGWAVALVAVMVAGGCAGPRRVECGAGLTAEWDGGMGDRGKDNGTWKMFESKCQQEMCKEVWEQKMVITGKGPGQFYPQLVLRCDDAAVRRCSDERACGELRRGQSK
jgi:hypothetical protein